MKETKKRLLLVDDSADFRQLVRAFLKACPYEILEAEDGASALELMKSQELDLVLMDLNMPMMDGITSTKLFRQWEKEAGKKYLPIVALTAFTLRQEREESLKAGMDQFLCKPIMRTELLDFIGVMLRMP